MSVKLIRLFCGEAGSSPIDVYEPFAVMVPGLQAHVDSAGLLLGYWDPSQGLDRTQHKACCFLEV